MILYSEDKISCLSHSNQMLGVGFVNGTVMIYCSNFDKQSLEQLHTVSVNDLVSQYTHYIN